MEKKKFKVSGISYTDDQTNALNDMLDMMYNDKELDYTLEGAAGTGKTTVLNEFIKQNRFTRSAIAVSAPTHKAVRIASETTGVKGSTIQKLLGLRPNVNVDEYDINRPKFAASGRKAIQDFRLVVIDESSMINSGLYTAIAKESKRYNTNIVYVGDSLQLPPVKEKISPVFTEVKNKGVLRQIVRQSEGNPLLELLDVVRTDARMGTFGLMNFLNKSPTRFSDDGHGFCSVKDRTFGEYLIAAFKSDMFSKSIDYAKYCSYTNDSVLGVNTFIRNSLSPDNHNNLIVKDDLITAYSTTMDEFNSPIIVNSEDYILDDFQDYRNQSGLKGYIVRFRKVFGGQFTPYMFVVDTSDQNNLLAFLTIANRLIKEAQNAGYSQRGKAWENFYSFKENNLLITDIRDDKDKIIISKDIDYGYALTVHKTQGSTYKNVFVNTRDIIYSKKGRPYANYELRNKLLYVAISRATDTATLLI